MQSVNHRQIATLYARSSLCEVLPKRIPTQNDMSFRSRLFGSASSRMSGNAARTQLRAGVFLLAPPGSPGLYSTKCDFHAFGLARAFR